MRHYENKASERLGIQSTSRDGKIARVVTYITCENFTIKFEDGNKVYPLSRTL